MIWFQHDYTIRVNSYNIFHFFFINLLFTIGVDSQGRGLLYNGIIDCFIKTGRSEGIYGFYKGIGANYMRLAPHGALCLVFWDLLKDIQIKHIDNRLYKRNNLH